MVSESFPLELRAQAIAVFFAVAQIFGALGPVIFGTLIGSGKDSTPITIGFIGSAILMMIGGVIAWFKGIDAEMKSLEDIANPLSMVRRPAGGIYPTVP